MRLQIFFIDFKQHRRTSLQTKKICMQGSQIQIFTIFARM